VNPAKGALSREGENPEVERAVRRELTRRE
jgi:hypothetical protein